MFVRLLSEKNTTTRNLEPNSEAKRKARSDDVVIKTWKKLTPSTAPRDKPLLTGWVYYEFVVSSKERTQNRDHTGYVVVDNNRNVKDVFCSCADFQFLWRYSLTRSDLASNVVYDGFKDIEDHAPYTGDPSNITNPTYDKKLCKHLIKCFKRAKI